MINDADSLKAEVAHMNMHLGHDPRMFKVPNDPRVTRGGAFPPPLANRRATPAPQRSSRRDVPRRPASADLGRGSIRRALGTTPSQPEAGNYRPLAGTRGSDIPFDEMTKLDYLYVTNWSLREDLRLIMLTLPALARARAAY